MIKLFTTTLIAYSITAIAIYNNIELEVLLGLASIPLLFWTFHLSLFLSKSVKKSKVLKDMFKLLPFYMVMVFKFFAVMLYPFVYLMRGWVYKTLGDKAKTLLLTHGTVHKEYLDIAGVETEEQAIAKLENVSFTWKEKLARLPHFFFEDEETLAGRHTGIYAKKDWVVDMVLQKKVGTPFTKLETFLVNLYWEGNRNIMANFECEILSKFGVNRDFKIITDKRLEQTSSSAGIGARNQGFSHTVETYGETTMPQFVYITDKLFITSGFGNSTMKPHLGYSHGFESSNRLIKK